MANLDQGLPRAGFRLKQGHLNALLMGNLLAQVGFWLLEAVRRFTVAPFGTDDFAIFRSAAILALDGRGARIYDADYIRAFQDSLGMPAVMPYLYPPFFLVPLIPFALLAPPIAYLLWGLVNMAVLGAATWLLARAFIPPRQRFTFALLLCSSFPAGAALELGQTSFVLLLGAAVATAGFLEHRDRGTGLGLAALLIKPQLLPLWLLMLAWYRRWRALAYFALASGVLLVVSALVVGIDGTVGYFGAVLEAGSEHKVGFQSPGSHTLAGLAYGLGGEATSRTAYVVTVGIAVGVFLWLLYRLQTQNPGNLRAAASLTVITAILVSSHTLLYDLVLWAVPLALFWLWLSRGWGRWLIAAGYCVPWFVSFFGMLGAGFVWPTVALMLLGVVLLARLTGATEQDIQDGQDCHRWTG